MRETAFRLYQRHAWLRRPKGLAPRLLGATFIGVHVPLLATVLWMAFRANAGPLPVVEILLVVLAGTLVGTLVTFLVMAVSLSPVSRAAAALEAYARDRTPPRLPTGLDDEAGRLLSAVEAVTETAERLIAAQERLAATDALTGLLNRRAFFERAEEERGRFDRHGRPAAIAVLDIDHFKRINDTCGHAAGDQVLRSVARLLRAKTRRQDALGRIGGEEFAIVFPDTGLEAARLALVHLRTALQTHAMPGLEGLAVTFSAGLTAFVADDTSIDEALARADAALYAAKRAGRDRVRVDEAADETFTSSPGRAAGIA